MFQDYSDSQIQELGNVNFDELVRREAARLYPKYNPSRYTWSSVPIDDQCPRCYEWRRFPPGQRHFGFAWWRICSRGCTCGHHKEEMWMAGISYRIPFAEAGIN